MARPRTGRPSDLNWAGANGETVGLAAGGLVGFLLATAVVSQTVMRIRGEVVGGLDLAGIAANDSAILGWGIQVMPAGAVAGGITTGPITTAAGSWMAFGVHPLRSDSGVASDQLGSSIMRAAIDTKAMRKMKASEELVLVFENLGIVGAPTINAVFSLRMLFAD